MATQIKLPNQPTLTKVAVDKANRAVREDDDGVQLFLSYELDGGAVSFEALANFILKINMSRKSFKVVRNFLRVQNHPEIRHDMTADTFQTNEVASPLASNP